MDKETNVFYEVNARLCVERYEQADMASLHEILKKYLRQGLSVLEVGGGSGRDAAFLTSVGCQVTITDGCQAMLDEVVRLHPELASHARVASFPLDQNDPLLLMRYDMILCMAVVMHLADDALFLFAEQLARMLQPGGIAVISHSNGRKDFADRRNQQGRLFRERTPMQMSGFFKKNGFFAECMCESKDGMSREGIFWITQIMRKANE